MCRLAQYAPKTTRTYANHQPFQVSTPSRELNGFVQSVFVFQSLPQERAKKDAHPKSLKKSLREATKEKRCAGKTWRERENLRFNELDASCMTINGNVGLRKVVYYDLIIQALIYIKLYK